MMQGTSLEQLLRELTAPQRNHYFYGKLMDVRHFEMEQTYINHKRWLINQQSLGAGVLCGLGVVAKDDKLWVEPGMAIDGYGREIIKPIRTSTDPWTTSDPCGKPQPELSKEARHEVTLWLCYKECLTDYMPVLVSDCGGEQDADAATLVETFQLAITVGAPARMRPVLDPRCCKVLFQDPKEDQPPGHDSPTGDPANRKEAPSNLERMRLNLCRCTAGSCRTPAEPCVALAVVELLPGGRIGRIEQCRYRERIYSNRMLLDLILCLAARLDECCKHGQQPQTPPKVAAVEFLDVRRDVLAELAAPSKPLAFQHEQLVRSMRIVFTQPVDPRTVVAGGAGGNPKPQSFLVMEKNAGLVPGTLTFESPRTVRWDFEIDAGAVGQYAVRLFGDGDAAVGRPAIASIDGVRLDGEPLDLPSGDNIEGGAFQFRFDIADEIGPDAPPKVASIFLVSSQNGVLVQITDPRDVPTVELEWQPRSIRIDFTADIDPTTVVATAPDPRALNFLVTDATDKHVTGTVTFEGPAQVRWTADAAQLRPGTFKLQLFGDADSAAGRRAIAGVNGLRLDGEPGAELPSGDGGEGGEFSVGFRVVGQTTGGDRS